MIPIEGTPKDECYVTLPGIIEVFAEETTAVDNIISPKSSTAVKYIRNGNLYIQTLDKTYNVYGSQVNK